MAVTQSLSVAEVSGSVNVAANTSKVRILWTSTQTGESWNGYTKTAKYYVSINGGDYTEYSVSYTLPQNATATIVDTTITVTHKDNGSGSVHVKTWMDTGISAGVVEKAYYCSLTTIPKAAKIQTASSVTLGGACSILCITNSTSVTTKWYKFKFSLGSWSYTTPIFSKTASTSFTYTGYTVPYDVAEQFPNDPSGKMTATLYTYESGTATTPIGDASSKNFTVTLPENDDTKPYAEAITTTPVSSLTNDFASLYLQGYSKVKVTSTDKGRYGATIASKSITIDGKTYGSESNYTSEWLSGYGTVTVTLNLEDSRGFTNALPLSITVIPYGKPRVEPASDETSVICARCDASGNLSDSGTYLKIKAKRNYSPVISSGVQKNFCSIRYRYKAVGGSYSSWATILATTASSDEVETGALLGSLDTKTSYLVQVQSIDTIGVTATANIPIPTERIYWHRAGSINSFGFGGYVEEENLFSIAGDIGFSAKGGFVPIEIPEYTDFDTLTKPNLYYARYTYVPGYVNCPISVQTTFSLEVIALGKDGQLLQRVTRCSAEATIYERQYYSSEWHEWECVNPPMVVGEEYRTKERYMGKPVYTKLIFCDTLPNAAYKLFEHGATATQAIRCVGQMSDGNSIPFHFSATNWVEIYAGPEYVVILTGNDKTNRSAYAQLWYVKE